METIKIENSFTQILTPEQAWYFKVIPFAKENGTIKVFSISENISNQDELEMILNSKVILEPIEEEKLILLLNKHYRKNISKAILNEQVSELSWQQNDFVENLIQEALQLNSSDIHIEPLDSNAKVRFRIDGRLIERHTLDLVKYAELINRIKIKANLDISEKRLPQDGRILSKTSTQKLDLRISIIPTLCGEKIVLRLLGTNAEHLDLNELGLTKEDLNNYLMGTKKSNGIILISGPTGSGKTTTLYATLKLLNKPDVNIMTIEDPVEYTLNGINQVQVKENIGLTFAASLRSFLRQDPDIIMVGEIRDKETAELAIRASLTGHLVLSTIHTNSAWGTINRLKDMGIPSFLIADTLNTSVAQRLLRTLCTICKVKVNHTELSDEMKNYIEKDKQDSIYKAVGCESCYFTGYSGRQAIYEVINVNEDVKAKIKNEDASLNKESKYKSLQQNALHLLFDGMTTCEEVYPILISK